MLSPSISINETIKSKSLNLNEIKEPIADVMKVFEKKFQASMKSSVPLLDKITHYIVKRKGKQMRPMFVFFSAGLFGNINESTHRGAALIELLHTATLVHDDVVDDSYLRRGVFSINALWKNKIAVLVGDYLLSKGLLLSLENKEYNLLQIVSTAVKQMSEGELLQIEKARKLDIDESVYFDIIKMKTASLIASCCASGAASAGCNENEIEKMRLLGEYIGIAFQIKDDLFDYEKSNQTGKPVGLDIKERKLTLPIIYSLKYGTDSEVKELKKIIKNKKASKKELSHLLDLVNGSGGIELAKAKMEEYQNKAFEILSQFEENVYQKSLFDLVRFTTERIK